MNTNKTVSRDFAEEISAFSYNDLSAENIEQLKLLIMDFCAVAICGAIQPWGQYILQWAASHGGRGNALALGTTTRLTAQAAALVNGTCGHGYELDDTHEASRSHPGCVVIATALAVATNAGASGREFLSAIVAGVEAMTRIGLAAYPTGRPANGMHKTAMFGHFGAAAAACRLMGMGAGDLNRAWGVSLSLVSGTTQFTLEPHGSMTKRLVGGIPAHNGILAAQIAATGMTAPEQPLEGRYGFFNLFGVDADPERLRASPQTPLETMDISLKPYACCRHFHSVIDALAIATDGYSLPAERIESITVHVPPSVVTDRHIVWRPKTVMAAQYSLPYIVGASLAYGPGDFSVYGDAFHEDAAILSLIDKVEPGADAELAAEALERMPARVELRLDTGEKREGKVLAASGSPENPLGRDGLARKMRSLADIVGMGLDVEGIIEAVDQLPESDDLTLLSDVLLKLAEKR